MLNNHQTTSETNTTSAATTTVANTTGTIPKEKSSKSAKHQQPRKPPPTIETFWPSIMQDVQNTPMVDAKHQALPLARIKKIMKLDENARMIAAEAPLLFAKACEFFIQELTMRAWIHTDESKRRTLQRSDIAQAIANYDQFDFLIDIVPREDIKPSSHHRKHHSNNDSNTTTSSATATTSNTNTENSENVNMPACESAATGTVPQVTTNIAAGNTNVTANNNQPAQVLTTTSTHPTQQLQIINQQAPAPQQQIQYFITLPGQQSGQHQLVTIPGQQTAGGQPQLVTLSGHQTGGGGQPQLVTLPGHQQAGQPQLVHQVQLQQHQQQHHLPNLTTANLNLVTQQQPQQVQVLQQVMVTPTGEITNMPITINANQLQLLRLQMQQQQQQNAQHQQQQTQAAPQQVIIPMVNAQQLLQLQQSHGNHAGNGATTAHIVHHQQPQTHHHNPATNTIYINASNTGTGSNVQSAAASMVSTDRNIGNTFRSNC